MRTNPHRLLNEQFFHDDLPIRLHHQILTERYELHWHEFYELTFVLSGEGVNTVNGVAFELGQGDLFLLTPADFHEIAPVPGRQLEMYNLIFSQQMLSEDMIQLLFAGNRNKNRMARFEDGTKYENLLFRFNSLRSETEHFAAGRDIALQCEIDRIIIEWHRGRAGGGEVDGSDAGETAPHREAPHHPGIHNALIYIQHHFRRPITLEEAAGHAHLSATYFSELFRKSVGQPFQQYLQQLRLQFAHSLLRASRLPVTEVCHVSGFNTLTHFERVYRQHFGMTPRETQKMKG